MSSADEAAHAARAFQLPGDPVVAGPLTGGLIHETWRVEAGGTAWVVQHLNRNVFHDIDAVMANVAAVSEHLARRLMARGVPDPMRRALTLVPTHDGRSWYEGPNGSAWRCTRFIDGTRVKLRATTPAEARQAGRAFGEFTALMEGLQTPLAITIPAFHHTATRLTALHDAIDRDVAGRVAKVQAEVEVLREEEALAHMIAPLLAAQALPLRPVHNDAKIGNLLFDQVTDEAVAILDLDTTMLGTSLHDIGDLIRSTVGSAPEDARDPGTMKVRDDLFRALVEGWFAGGGECFTPLERELTLTAGRIIVYEQAVRFLTDYLDGDRYYVRTRPEQNLDRARAQIALLLDLTARADELEEIVAAA